MLSLLAALTLLGDPGTITAPGVDPSGNARNVMVDYSRRPVASAIAPYTTIQSLPGGAGAWQVQTGDINNDGYQDVLLAAYIPNQVDIYLGSPSGILTPNGYVFADGGPVDVAIGDFNNDGNLDFVVANYYIGNIQSWLGDGGGGFSLKQTITATGVTNPRSIVVGALGNDNFLSVVLADYATTRIDVFRGNGDGTFQTPTALTGATTGSQQVLLYDINADGVLDIIEVGAIGGSPGIGILYGSGTDTSFGSVVTVPPMPGAAPVNSIAIADINGDSQPDILHAGADGVFAMLGQANASTWHAIGGVVLGTGNVNFIGWDGINVGDVNADGYPDIVVSQYFNNNGSTGDFNVFLGNGTGSFSPYITYMPPGPVNRSFQDSILSDLNNDGLPDFLVVNTLADGNSWKPNNVNLAQPSFYTVMSSMAQVPKFQQAQGYPYYMSDGGAGWVKDAG